VALGVTEALDVTSTPVSESGHEVDVLLECSGHPAATADAIRAVAPAGTVVLVGMGGDEMALPVSRIQERELTLTGTFRYAHTWPAAIALAASGRVQLDRLVTGHYGLDQVREALTVARTDPHAVKPMVVPGL
jgi:L-iditol 2-dehydrogenase